MSEQKKDVKESAREYLERLKKEREELAKSDKAEKEEKSVKKTSGKEQITVEEKEKERQAAEEKRLVEERIKAEEREEAEKHLEDERMKAEEREKEKKFTEKESKKEVKDKQESEDIKLGQDLARRKEEAVKRKEEERLKLEKERLIRLKEDEEKAKEEKKRIIEEKKIEVKKEEKAKEEKKIIIEEKKIEVKKEEKEEKVEVKKEVPKPAGGFARITKSITTTVTAPLLMVVKLMQQALASINKVVITFISIVTNAISKIISSFFKLITIVVTAFIPTITWVVSAMIRFARISEGFIRGLQDKLINGATSKAKQITPKKITSNIDGMIVYGGVKKTSSQIISSTAIYAVVFSLFAGAVAFALHLPGILVFGALIAGFALVFIVIFIVLNMLADRRAEAVEQVLPDVLQIVSVNMVAGMTPYNSLLVAARPEFGPLAEEIHKAVQDTLSGKPLVNSLDEMAARVKSDKLKRCVKLMVQGMNSGGELSTVLQEIAKDIRYMQNLQKEMKANTTGFSMFILFAILIGAPLLLGVSITFVQIFSAIFSTIDVASMGDAAQASMISLEGLSITPDFFWMYAVFVLMISGFFGGVMIGVLQSGKASSGITMGPILAIVAVVIFIVLHGVLISVFGGAIINP